MSNERSINIGDKTTGNVVNLGDNNRIDAQIAVSLTKVTLPPPESVNIDHELAQIRSLLESIGGEHAGRIGRAMDDASAELRADADNKDEIGAALERALDYAKKSSGFADEVGKLAPHVQNAAAWLGANWHKLLGLVGLTL